MSFRAITLALCLVSTGAVTKHASAEATFPPLSSVTPPAVDPAIAELGYLLFFDPRMSGDSSTACSECHSPRSGWTDGSDLGRGYPGTKHWRNSQTVVNSALIGAGLHWDASLKSLNEQVHSAMGAGVNLNIDTTLAEERLRQIPEYRERFISIWGEEPTLDRLTEAIAAYEGTLISNDSPFDNYLAGDANAMSSSAQRGMEVFTGKGNCVSCHNGALLSDGEFHNTSVPINPEQIEDPLRQVTFRLMMRLSNVDPRVYNSLDRDPGRYLATKQPDDLGTFRTAPLRYLKYTAPYMHNGVFYTLEEVVDFYNIGGTQDVLGTKSELIRPLNLSRDEKQDLVAFLESLSGSEVKAETPELPSYEIMPSPSQDEVITLARLENMELAVNDAGATTQSDGQAAEPSGLKIESRQESPGLVIVARNTNDASAAATPSDESQPRIEITFDNATEEEEAGRFEIVAGERFVTVQEGDTLSTLAILAYGDKFLFQKIYDANRKLISNPNVLILGSRLRVPD